MKKYLLSLFTLFGLYGCLHASPKIPQSNDAAAWPTYQGNTARTGYVPITIPSKAFHVIWQKQLINDPVKFNINNLSCTENQLFVSAVSTYNGGTANYLLSVDGNTGNIQWEKHLPDLASINGPTYYNGNIYVETISQNTQGNVSMYQASSGNLLHQFPFDTQWDNYLPVAAVNNNLYFGGGFAGGMYSYNITTKQNNWINKDLGEDYYWAPTIYNQYVLAFVSFNGTPYLNVLDAKTGKQFFRIQDPHGIVSKEQKSPGLAVDTQNHLIFTLHARYLSAYDFNTQKMLYDLGPYMNGQPDIANGVVYLLYANNLLAINEKTKQVNWEWTTDTDLFSTETPYGFIVTNNVLFISSETTTYAISLTTHHTLWSYPKSGHLAINQNTLFIVTDSGMAYAIGF